MLISLWLFRVDAALVECVPLTIFFKNQWLSVTYCRGNVPSILPSPFQANSTALWWDSFQPSLAPESISSLFSLPWCLFVRWVGKKLMCMPPALCFGNIKTIDRIKTGSVSLQPLATLFGVQLFTSRVWACDSHAQICGELGGCLQINSVSLCTSQSCRQNTMFTQKHDIFVYIPWSYCFGRKGSMWHTTSFETHK